MKRYWIRLCIGLSAVCFFLLCLSPVLAEGEPSFGLSPYSVEAEAIVDHLDYTMAAGEQSAGAVLVSNMSEEVMHLHLQAADAHTSLHGGVDFGDGSEPASATGTWLSFSELDLDLEPLEERVVPFQIQVPVDAALGEHRAGVLLELADQDTAPPVDAVEGNIYVAVRFRKALNLRVTVPGVMAPDFKIDSVEHVFDHGRSTFNVAMSNTGNQATDVTGGTLQVFGAQGAALGTLPIRMNGKFLARDSVVHPVSFEEPLPAGEYALEATIHHGDGQEAVWRSTFSVNSETAASAEEDAVGRGLQLPERDQGMRLSGLSIVGIVTLALFLAGGLMWLGLVMGQKRAAKGGE